MELQRVHSARRPGSQSDTTSQRLLDTTLDLPNDRASSELQDSNQSLDIQRSSVEYVHAESLGDAVQRSSRSAWFWSVAAGLVLSLVVLCVNIGIIIWVSLTFIVKNGIADVYHAPCNRTAWATTLTELLINIFSTLLLAASNNCGQLLLAPNRQEVEKAHQKGKWMHIGVSSFRNVFYIRWQRAGFWLVLSASSMPLQLAVSLLTSHDQALFIF